jgi:CRISPR-associated endonuclease/helicase Cas3
VSEVSERATRFRDMALPDQSAPEIAAFTENRPDWKRASLTVCSVGEDGWTCEEFDTIKDRE